MCRSLAHTLAVTKIHTDVDSAQRVLSLQSIDDVLSVLDVETTVAGVIHRHLPLLEVRIDEILPISDLCVRECK